MVADNDGIFDGERGSISNTSASPISITTNQLTISSGDGVGQIGNGLRTNVDQLDVENSTSNEIVLLDTNDLVVERISNSNGNVSLFAGGFLRFDGSATANEIRLVAQGDVTQSSGSVIAVSELGVIQNTDTITASNDPDANNRLDVILDQDNQITVVAATNVFDGGVFAVATTTELTVGSVVAETIAQGVEFAATSGLTTLSTAASLSGSLDGDLADILVQSSSSIQIDESVVAGGGAADVRITANGVVGQTVSGTILANELGVRQESIGAIQLLAQNDVEVLTGLNANGDLRFLDVDNLVVGNVTGQTFRDLSFTATNGLGGADILLMATGSLRLESAIDAGDSDVFIEASGDITQASTSFIFADQLGVRQEASVFSGSDDFDGNNRFDILLTDDNDVSQFAAFNLFDTGVIAFNDIDDLEIDRVESLFFSGIGFNQTNGLATTSTGAPSSGATDVADGDILVNVGGDLQINQVISSGNGSSDVRLIAQGDFSQLPTAVITADELGVRQESTVAGDIVLEAANNVNVLAALNQFDGGDLEFSNANELTIGQVAGQQASGIDFAQTTGVSASGDVGVRVLDGNLLVASPVGGSSVLLQSAGAISVASQVAADELRLAAEGDISQTAAGVIISPQLGIQQTGISLDSLADLDGNGRHDIVLDADNEVEVIGIRSDFIGGAVAFNNSDGLVIGAVEGSAIGNTSFAQTAGIVSQGDVLLQTGGSLNLEEVVSVEMGLSDVRFITAGDIDQESNAIIVADELGIRQAEDANSAASINLDAVNQVSTFSAANPDGDVNFTNGPDLTIGTVLPQQIGNIEFGLTTGVVAESEAQILVENGSLFVDNTVTIVDGEQLLLQSDGAISLNDPVSAVEVRLIASGDIFQSASGVITADRLGIRQEGTSLAGGEDRDGNSQFDVILDEENDVGQLAIENAFDGGVVGFRDVGDFAVGTVDEFTFEEFVFSQTIGIVSLGDVLLSSGGALGILDPINAGNELADVGLIAQGDIFQDSDAIIVADELGVRQEAALFVGPNDVDGNGAFDIVLSAPNSVSTFAASNSIGDISLVNAQSLIVGTVGRQAIGNIELMETVGVESGGSVGISLQNGNLLVEEAIFGGQDILLQSAGSISLDGAVTTDEVRLIAMGDVFQTEVGDITSSVLGIRQQGSFFEVSGDLDENGRYDIVLDGNNQVETLTGQNLFEGGVVAFNNNAGLVVGAIGSRTFGDIVFESTAGIESTGTLAADAADILLQTSGFLSLSEGISAGNGSADVRLLAAGDINQEPNAIIVADALGVRQEAALFVGSNDIMLNAPNSVSTFAASNLIGDTSLVNARSLAVGTVGSQLIGDIEFLETAGVESGGTVGIALQNGGLVVEDAISSVEDVLLQSAGSISLDGAVTADEVRLIAMGDVFQSETGAISSGLLGIRQQGSVFETSGDLDGNQRYDIVLDDNNQVLTLASQNLFEGGGVAFNNNAGLIVGTVGSRAFGDIVFESTEGIESTGDSPADVLLETGGFLNLLEGISAGDGNADVRLIAAGDITQEPNAIVVADELGVRLADGVADGTLIDLDSINQVSTFAASNSNGDVNFTNGPDLTIGTVSQQEIENIEFEPTVGVDAGSEAQILVENGNLFVDNTVTIVDGDRLLLQSDGFISLDSSISAAEVRLIASGDIFQSSTGTITAELLGVRQEGTFPASDGDQDGNGRFDVILDDGNDADVIAISNAFDGGVIAFRDIDDLTIGEVPELTIENLSFVATQGLTSVFTESSEEVPLVSDRGDIFVQANGDIQIDSLVVAGANPEAIGGAGNADLRLIADGTVAQTDIGVIRAQELGVRLAGANEIQNILLDQNNDVSIFSAENNSDGGFAVISDADDSSTGNQGLTIGTVASQEIGNLVFEQSIGIITTHSGTVIEGATDNDLGDVLVNSNGSLRLNAQVSAASGNSDFRITALGDVQQDTNAPITANELGVHQASVVFDEVEEIEIDGQHSIALGALIDEVAINKVDIVGLFNQESEGGLIYRDVDQVTIDSVFGQTLGAASFISVNGIVSDNGISDLSNDGGGDIIVSAATNLDDGDGVLIVTSGDAALRGDARVELANQTSDQLIVEGNTLIQSASIAVGQDGEDSGAESGNVRLGSLTVDDLEAVNSAADITEDDDTILSSQTLLGSINNRSDVLILTSGGSITNDVAASLSFDRVQFNAVSGNVFIGNQSSDSFSSLSGPEIEIGINAVNVSIASESSIQINGLAPLIDNTTADLDLTDNFGTSVSETLFVDSQGHISQLVGSLDAAEIGFRAGEHVQLELVAAGNRALAVQAADASVSANLASHQAVLNQLQTIVGSEVDSELIQSIAIAHDQDLTVGTVSNPDTDGELLSVAGVTTSSVDNGSILLTAEDLISLEQSVVAAASNSLPQVTVYVQNSDANLGSNDDASQVVFADGAEIIVDGVQGAANNQGVVNAAQTVAFFGSDADGNGAIDTFFFDENQNGLFDDTETSFATTSIISLDSTSTAPQLFQGIYGNDGEAGYRFAFVFDSERRFDDSFTGTQETPNLYTTNGSTETESFEVEFQSILEPTAEPATENGLAVQTGIIEQATEFEGEFNFNSVFEKVDPFTSEALSARTASTLIFTAVEVRNDQDINLFVGPDASNTLNAVSDILEAQIETAGGQPAAVQFIFVENVIPEIILPDRLSSQTPVIGNVELPELTIFETQGTLSWIAVKIDDPDDPGDDAEKNISEVDGELVLNYPLTEYEKLNADDQPKKLDGAKRNQYEQIKEIIEADPEAEVGLWYKIYINNEANSNDDDLLFYYRKTGVQEETDLGPKSNFAPDDQTEEIPIPEANDSREPLFDGEVSLTNVAPAIEPIDGADSQVPMEPSQAALPVTVMFSALANASQKKSQATSDEKSEPTSSEFKRLNCLKQRLKYLLHQSH